MAKILQTQNILIAVFVLITTSLAAQTPGELLAMNTESVSYKSEVSEVSNFTNVHDITATNYFQLTGKVIHPYLAVKNVSKGYEAVKIDANNKIALSFSTKSVQYTYAGKTYNLNVNGVDQYFNTSEKCLVRGKIEVSCEAMKINGEKINSLSLYFDQNNHISYIEVGDTELYLRP